MHEKINLRKCYVTNLHYMQYFCYYVSINISICKEEKWNFLESTEK